jgi:ElaB/YqjD/DUF883 family membrane-anchored ribosome-binding protein
MPDVGEVTSKAGEAGTSAVSAAADALPSREQVRQAASVAQSNPLGLLLGSAAVGFLIGLAVPSTRLEDEKIGELADDLKHEAKQVGKEAAQHGREIAQEAAQTVQEAGKEHAGDLAETVQQRAEHVRADH